MSKNNGSVAPKERINIKYVPATGDQQEEIELPLKMLVMGDFKGRSQETSVEERESINIDKTNFSEVLKSSDLKREISVKNTLSDDEDASMNVSLKFEKIEDFGPDAIAQQVPEIKTLIDLREALVALKGPLGNVPAFRKRIEQLLDSEEDRERLLGELKSSD